MYFLPRRTIACERVFQEQGVYGDIVAGELPINFIPYDSDVLSLEMGSAFRVSWHLSGTCRHPSSTTPVVTWKGRTGALQRLRMGCCIPRYSPEMLLAADLIRLPDQRRT